MSDSEHRERQTQHRRERAVETARLASSPSGGQDETENRRMLTRLAPPAARYSESTTAPPNQLPSAPPTSGMPSEQAGVQRIELIGALQMRKQPGQTEEEREVRREVLPHREPHVRESAINVPRAAAQLERPRPAPGGPGDEAHVRPPTRRGAPSGVFRNHAYHATAHTTPSAPRMMKAPRHPAVTISHATAGSAKAAPRREPEKLMPCASPRSAVGSQRRTLWRRSDTRPLRPRRTEIGRAAATRSPTRDPSAP